MDERHPLARRRPVRADRAAVVAFHGAHQAGIVTAPQQHLVLAAFDLTAERAADLRDLLVAWSVAAARLMAGRRSAEEVADGRGDSGEAHDLPPARLTVTFGLGLSLFTREGEDRLGLRARQPVALRPLPAFRGDALQARRCDGDLCVQVCADDPQVAFHAFHTLARAGSGTARVRWAQTGFLPRRPPGPGAGPGPGASPGPGPGARPTGPSPAASPRDLLGFRDGTANPRTPRDLDRHVWVQSGDRSWMSGGTYLVARRIRLRLHRWDATPVERQERVIGRHKASGAPLGGRLEYDPRRFDALRDGEPVIPLDAHVRLAAAESNQGVRMLRRSYNYFDGVDPETGELDAGLQLLAFQRDPRRHYVPVQRQLAERDALAEHLVHTGSAVFAIPPGPRPGGFVAEGLFTGPVDNE